LIDTYFAPELHASLHAQAVTNQAAFQYSLTLVEEAKSGKRLQEALIPYSTIPPTVRDQGFRRAVVTAYAHRCAFCGIRMRTPDGHTVVDAAHIIPWAVSRNDDPRNGLSLCKLCHWTFDEGLLGVSHHYQVIATKALTAYGNIAGHLLTLHEQPIFQPVEVALWPDRDALHWHRTACLRP
jgi:putative restriction endonuclease